MNAMKKFFAVGLTLLMLTAGCSGTPAASEPSEPSEAESSLPLQSEASEIALPSEESAPVSETAGTSLTVSDEEILRLYQQQGTLSMTFKGLEIYCWSENGEPLCGILPGTNRSKETSELDWLLQHPATLDQLALLTDGLDREEVCLIVLNLREDESAAADAVYARLDMMGFYNLRKIVDREAGSVSVSALVMAAQTDDWYSLEEDPENGGDWTVTAEVPDYFQQDGEDAPTFSSSRSGLKILELVAVVHLKEGQRPYDRLAEELEDPAAAQKEFVCGENSGTVRMVPTQPSGGTVSVWYPYTFWIVDGEYAAGVTFYSLETDSSDVELMERIVASVKFERSGE